MLLDRRHAGLVLALAFCSILGACGSVEEERVRAENRTAELVEARGITAPVFDADRRNAELQPLIAQLLQEELTETNAVRIAILNSPRLRARFEALGIGAAHLVQAGLLTNPVFAASIEFSKAGSDTELALAKSFLEIFHLPLRQAKAEAELDAAIAGVTRDLVGLAFEVRREFWRNRQALVKVQLQTEIEATAATAFELMAKLHQAGNVNDVELSLQEVSLTRARFDLAQAQAQAVDSREPLNVLLGLWGKNTSWRLKPQTPPEGETGTIAADDESRAIGMSLDLAVNRARANAKAQVAGLESWERILPELELGPSATRTESGEWSVGPELAISLPLFDQGQAQSAAAAAELRMILAEHVALAVEIRASLRRFRERLVALDNQREFYRSVHLPAQKRLLVAVLKNYNAMQIGAFDVLKAKQTEMAAQREFLELQFSVQLARLDYEEILLGRLNHDRVAAAMRIDPQTQSTEESGGH